MRPPYNKHHFIAKISQRKGIQGHSVFEVTRTRPEIGNDPKTAFSSGLLFHTRAGIPYLPIKFSNESAYVRGSRCGSPTEVKCSHKCKLVVTPGTELIVTLAASHNVNGEGLLRFIVRRLHQNFKVLFSVIYPGIV